MIEFIKMHGIGNDYIYLDCIANPMPNNIEQFARHASDRHTGIGGDGVVLILPSDIADCRMRMFNADGSEGRMCGNAIRCVGKYYYETYMLKDAACCILTSKASTNNSQLSTLKSQLSVETLSGIKYLTLNITNNVVESVTVDMGIPSLQPTDIPILTDQPFINQTISIESQNNCALCIVHCALAVSMGNPHLILPINDIDHYPLHELGPLWENHPLFPDRVNTEIVEQLSPTHLRMRVWERGSGETLACGTGACAVVVAFTHLGRIPKGEPITVSLIGGNLTITYRDDNHVLMQGTATEVFRGQINF
ncbi:MAG: diaminopimelate epimerase [Paludibacteraceae bacterium]|nr:diaminopimelate epimerase [Paludibacteraceae bacterium]